MVKLLIGDTYYGSVYSTVDMGNGNHTKGSGISETPTALHSCQAVKAGDESSSSQKGNEVIKRSQSVSDELRGQQYRMDKALRALLEESKTWDIASMLSAKFYRDIGTKFITEIRHNGHWIVVQWVTTRSKVFDTGPLASPGRVGIARHRGRAFRRMAAGRWLHDGPEPQGPTIAVRFFPRIGTSPRGLSYKGLV